MHDWYWVNASKCDGTIERREFVSEEKARAWIDTIYFNEKYCHAQITTNCGNTLVAQIPF